MKLMHLKPEIPNKGEFVSDEFDPRATPEGYCAQLSNVIVDKDGVEKRKGYRTFPPDSTATNVFPLAGPIVGLSGLTSSTDVKNLLVHTPSGTFLYESALTKKTFTAICTHKICTCEAITDWAAGGTAVVSAVDERKSGAKAIKVVFPALNDAATYTCTSYDDTAWATYIIGFWIMCNVTAIAGDYTLTLDTQAYNIPAIPTANVWQYVEIVHIPVSATVTAMKFTKTIAGAATDALWIDDVGIRPALGAASTVFVRDCASYDMVFWSNNSDGIFYWSWDSTPITELNVLSGTGVVPNQAKVLFMSLHGDRLHLMDCETHLGVRKYNHDQWSDVISILDTIAYTDTKWSQLSNSSDPIEACLPMESGRDILYRRESMWERIYVGADDQTYVYRPITGGYGCACGRTARRCGDKHIWQGWESIYLYDGQKVNDIAETVAARMSQLIDRDLVKNNFAVIDEVRSEYRLHTVMPGSTYPTHVWVYNWRYNTWTEWNMTDNIQCGTEVVVPTVTQSLGWDELVGSWTEQDWRWNQGAEDVYNKSVFYGDVSGYVYRAERSWADDNATAVSAYVVTRAYTFDDTEQQDRFLKMTFCASGTDVVVWYSTDLGASWQQATTFTLSVERKVYEYYTNVRARQIQYKFVVTGSGSVFKLFWLYPSAQQRSIKHDTEESTV